MTKVDLIFHYGGDWITEPKVMYKGESTNSLPGYDTDLLSYIDIVNEFNDKLDTFGVQQLIVAGPSGDYYEICGDDGIRSLLSFVDDKFNVINLFVTEDCELSIPVPYISTNFKPISDEVLEATYGSDDEDGEDCQDKSDSSSDYDSEELERLTREKMRAVTPKLLHYKELDRSMTFKDIAEARQFMKMHALATSKGLRYVKNDPTRLKFKCRDGCPFQCLISKDGKNPGVRFKGKLILEHDCEPEFGNKMVDGKTIAYYFRTKLQNDPRYKIKEMRADLKASFNLHATHGKVKREKRMCLEKLEGSFNDEYNKLEAYINELKMRNPGSDVIRVLSEEELKKGIRVFSKMYVCFHAMKMGYKAGLRPFIGLDGTFLRGKATGVLLAAVGLDANNQVYPLAWAVVSQENKVNWTWFLTLLAQSLELNNGAAVTLISDMQKGLIESVKDVLPEANKRSCARHVEGNWSKNNRGQYLQKLFWWCAWSSFKEELEEQLLKMKEQSEEAVKDFYDYPLQSWCRVYFDTDCKNQAVDNNFTESFNSRILDARHKPIIAMFEEIRKIVMKWWGTRESEVVTWGTDISPYAMKLYNEYLKIAHTCTTVGNNDEGFEVTEGKDGHTVETKKKMCTCRIWDLTGIPCPHAISALLYAGVNPTSEVHKCYSKKAYLATYKHKLQPVRGVRFWKTEPSQAMKPPPFKKLVGRPKVKRDRKKDEAIKRQGEWGVSRKGRVMTCTTCGVPGHNARGCKKQGKSVNKKQKKANKRKRNLVDEDNEEEYIQGNVPTSSLPADPNYCEVDYPLSAPQSSQASGSCSGIFMPTPTIPIFSCPSVQPNFLACDDDSEPAIRPRIVSELKTRLLPRQHVTPAEATRKIRFVGDSRLLVPNLPVSPRGLTFNGNEAITTNQLENQRQKKLRTRKGKGKSQK